MTAIISAVWVSCTEIVPVTYDKGITLDTQSIDFVGDGDSRVVKITSNSAWSLNMGGCTWITPSKLSGEATEKIILTCEKNPSTTDSRTASIDFISGTSIQTIEITQERFMSWITVDLNGQTYYADNLKPSETIELQIKSNTSWTAEADEGIILSQNSGEGNATVTVTVDNSNITVDRRRSSVTFSCEENSQTFYVEQVCTYANTYIIKEPGSYSIPAAKPDGTAFADAASATWMYESKNGIISNVKYNSGKIDFDIASIGGYAVVVLQNSTGEVIWCYTLWCTEEVNDITVGADVYMDRNIGAWTTNLPISDFGNASDESAYGCYYQWGRKEAFPGPCNAGILKTDANRESDPFSTGTIAYRFNTGLASGFGPDETSPTTVSHNTANPWGFSHKQFDPNDPELRTLWADAYKTVYDPCPAGYKVPSAQQTEDMINTLAGWTKTEPFSSVNSYSRVYSSGSVQFSIPSTGYRMWSLMKSSGRMAAYWTSTFSEKDGSGKSDPRYAYRNYDFKLPLDGQSVDVTNRAYGVRCVKIN